MSDGFVDEEKLRQLLAQYAAQGQGSPVLSGKDMLSTLNPLSGVTLQNPEVWTQAAELGGQPGSELYTQGAGANLDPSSKRYTDPQGRLYRVTGTDESGNTLIQFTDNSGGGWQNPTGGPHDRVQPTYSLDKSGNATPVDAGASYQPGAWVDYGRDLAKIAAVVGTAGAAGAYLAPAAGLEGGAAAAGAGGGGITTAESTASLGGLGTGAETSVAAQLGAEVGAGMAPAAGAGAGGLSSADLAALYGAEGYGSGMTAAEVAASAGAAEAGAAGAAGAGGLSSADTAAIFGPEGYGAAVSPAEMAAAGGGGGFSSLLSQLTSGNFGGLFKTGGQGYGLLQTLSALYGLSESNKIKQESQAPGMTKAGLDAVQRSWAAQGYQGSGNIMAAIERYGAETNKGNVAGQMAGLQGQLSSLGLLTAGLPALFGWNTTTGGG